MPDEIVAEKKCKVCGESKPHDQFYLRKSKRVDGSLRVTLLNLCIKCNSDYRANLKGGRRGRWRGRRKQLPTEKFCKGCQQTKTADKFVVSKSVTKIGTHTSKLQNICKECRNAQYREKRKGQPKSPP